MKKKKPGKRVSASEKEYNDLAKRVEAKIKRVTKNYGIDLTTEIPVLPFSNLTTKQRNEQKEKMKSFTNRANTKYQFRKNDYGVVASVRELNQAKRDTDLAIKKVNKLVKEIHNKQVIGGKGVKVGEYNKVLKQTPAERLGITLPEKFNFKQFRSKSKLDRRIELLEKKARGNYYEEKFNQLRENVINKLDTLFNTFTSDDVVYLLRQLSDKEFTDFYARSKNVKIDEYPTTLGQPEDSDYTQLGHLLNELKQYIAEKDNHEEGDSLDVV